MHGTMMHYPLALSHILERAGKYFPEVEIVSRRPDHGLHRYSYADLYRRARSLAEALQKAGLKRGDRVATLMWNHHAHLEAYFGIPICGGVLHTLNLRLAPAEIAYIANHAQDRFLIVDDILLPLYEKIRDSVSFERVIVVRWPSQDAASSKSSEPVSSFNSDGISSSRLATRDSRLPKLEDYDEFLATASGNFQYPDLDENEAASLCYTSGTTGIPKGVAYTHRSVMLHTFLLTTVDNFGICNADSVLPIVSMFHVNGWGLSYAATLVGAKQVLPGPHLKPDSLLELCEGENVTVAAGVPTVWHSIFECLEQNPGRRKLPAMRVLIGGAAPSLALIRKLHRNNCTLAQGWGLTESSPQATTNQLKAHMKTWPEDDRNEVRAQAGLPVPFVERRVVTGQGENPFEEVPWDGQTMGEVQLRGPWVAASYYNLPAENDKWTADGWFRTSDVGTVNAEGYLRVVDRTKDLIKSGGEWISSV
ncbi:MAG: AMP-binding protein, partial [Terriglobales bacterium]